MNRRIAWAVVALSTLFILIATLHVAGTALPPGWSFDLTSGDAALAELIQNLLLFIPLGASLTLAGIRPLRTVPIGTALSFSVEFLQQWIPGRDPSVGDIVSNTVSTALGIALVVAATRWLWTPPQRSARQALGMAVAAVLVWAGTGFLLRPILPEPPYRDVWTPRFSLWGHYRGTVLAARLDGTTLSQDTIENGQALLKTGQPLQVTAVAASRPPHRTCPLVALLDRKDTKVLVLSVDGTDLVVHSHMKAIELTLEDVDLRWRNALARVAPQDTFVAQTWRGEHGVCLSLNSDRRCGLGYTIGDGWKLIYYPADFPAWLDSLINLLWIAGWTVGVGYWGGRAGKTGLSYAAGLVVVVGMVAVPLVTGLKTTPMVEWMGLIAGLTSPLVAREVAKLRRRRSGFKHQAASF